MGLSTAPASFQLLMDTVLRGLTFKSCLRYLDDVLICSETFEQHIKDLNDVFSRFRSAGLKLFFCPRIVCISGTFNFERRYPTATG